ncbi:hypothetical protein BASA60_004710 [Batrachochytrium salamandrivorans]|nr:hypothetical protein BASA60_004710 [Batrachochytrium salamandrivorans]
MDTSTYNPNHKDKVESPTPTSSKEAVKSSTSNPSHDEAMDTSTYNPNHKDKVESPTPTSSKEVVKTPTLSSNPTKKVESPTLPLPNEAVKSPTPSPSHDEAMDTSTYNPNLPGEAIYILAPNNKRKRNVGRSGPPRKRISMKQ